MVWSLSKRVAFRFGFSFLAVYVYPWPLVLIPKIGDWLSDVLNKPFEWLFSWFGESVLGLPPFSTEPTGSGDTTAGYVNLLVTVLLAVVATISWSILDRRRTSYPRLASGARVTLRYVLASAMLSYGVSKVMRMQFGDLSPGQLDIRYGDKSPMGVLWSFMNYSAPYTIFAGLSEVAGGLLLLWRRTQTLGALLVIAVMTNVVMLNFCYDVPVKLYSSELLLMAMVVALPDARRLIAALLGRATAEIPPRKRWSPRLERARLVAKIALLVGVIVVPFYEHYELAQELASETEITGQWKGDGDIRMVNVGTRYVSIRHADDTREYAGIEVDSTRHALVLTMEDSKEAWSYAFQDHDHLRFVGLHAGKPVSLTLERTESPLLTRGFHWIQEFPFNR